MMGSVDRGGIKRRPTIALVVAVPLLLLLLSASHAQAAAQLEIDAYQDALNVSPEKAEKLIEIQARGGTADIAGDLEDEMGNTFGGVWFDQKSGEYVVAAASNTATSTVEDEMHAARLGGNYHTKVVSHSWEELEAAQDELNRQLVPFFDAGLVYTSLDPRTNAAVLHVAAKAGGGERAALTRIATGVGDEVEIRNRAESGFGIDSRACNAWGPPSSAHCGTPFRGGVAIDYWHSPNYGKCTSGFRAIGPNGQRYVITAAHCVLRDLYHPDFGNPISHWQAWNVHIEQPTYLGQVEQISPFPAYDWTKINVTGSNWDTWNSQQGWPSMVASWETPHWEAKIPGPVDHEYEIYGEAKTVTGQMVCHTGIATGATCGEVVETDVSDKREGGMGHDLVKVEDSCNWFGDSGGPWFFANTAYGIHNAGDGAGPCEGYAYYGEITQAAQSLGVNVGSGPPPPSPSPPTVQTKAATNVSEFQATVNGIVNPNGSATTYRFQYGTTTSYGQSIPIPDGNAGGGTSQVSVSAPADRLQPGTTYHYRLIASNPNGTSYGADQSFRTPGWRFMRGLSNGGGVGSWSTAIGMDLPLMAVGDVNGDGKADVVSVEKDNGLYRYKFGSSNGSSIPGWDQILGGMQLPTRLALGDLGGDGKADVFAVEPEGNGKYRYMLGTSNGSGITSWSQVMSGMDYPHKLAVADLTGDGKADIVSVESEGNGKYRYMLGTSNGSGIASWSQVMNAMSYAEFMDLGDLTGDGKADIVAVEAQGNGKYRYMLGTSNGSGIASWNQVMSEMGGPYFLSAGDVNADGRSDIVSVEAEGNGKYRYMLGTSNGAGIGSWSQILSGISLPARSDLGDLTGDGKADIVSTETEATGSYSYRLGISSGSGVSNWNRIVSWMRTPRATAVGDVNADGKADIVSVESEGNGKYRYMLGTSNGNGIVSDWKTLLTGMGLPNAVRVRDLSGDGKADVVAIEPEGNGKYRYMLGVSNGVGISSWSSILSGMSLPTRMNLGDHNGDGKADIIVFEPDGTGKYRIMRGLSNGAGISSWSQILGGLSYPQKAAVADLSGDGKADIVAVEAQGNGKYRYMLGTSNGSGISSWSQVMSEMSYAEFMDLGDLSGDGKADIVAIEAQGNGKYRYMLGTSNGAGISGWSQVMSEMDGPYFFHAGDLNADGKADIVSAETM